MVHTCFLRPLIRFSLEAFRDSHLARYDHSYVCLETSRGLRLPAVTLKPLNRCSGKLALTFFLPLPLTPNTPV